MSPIKSPRLTSCIGKIWKRKNRFFQALQENLFNANDLKLKRNLIFGNSNLQLTIPSGGMLSIAKSCPIRGNFHSTRKAISDSILAILNFDFAGETILKAVLLNSGGSIEKKSGGFKNFAELIQDCKTTEFPNIYTEELNNLHKLRNSVQHHCNIPSNQEVLRHNNTIKLFFNKEEICQKAYKNSVSYESISLALFIESESEFYT